MNYNVYLNISKSDFKKLHEQIINLETTITSCLMNFNFKLNDHNFSDGLGLDYNYENLPYMGSVGFKYDDYENKQSFSFYLIKTKDMKDGRVFKKFSLAEGIEAKDLKAVAIKIFTLGIEIFFDLKDEDLNEYVKFS
jgi:hypothetical protein